MKVIHLLPAIVAAGLFGIPSSSGAIELTGGQGSSSSSNMAVVHNDCNFCATDGDINSAREFTATSLLTNDGHLNPRATQFFDLPAVIETVTARVSLDASKTPVSTRTLQGSFQLQYLDLGGDYITFESQSFGPTSDMSAMISWNQTFTNLNLPTANGVRLLAAAETSSGNGTATFQLNMYHLAATGTYVPEPSTLALALCGGSLTFIGRRKRP